MASYSEKFDAAVSVIKNLPKNGPFQPSYDMMKRFYGLYKQATEGPCSQTKPAFWNVVQTNKWQAWSVLGDMPSDQAKELYVEELLKIIETMPQTDDVVSFLQVMGPFFELVMEGDGKEDQRQQGEALLGPKATRVNGLANGEVTTGEHGVSDSGDHKRVLPNGRPVGKAGISNGHLENGVEGDEGSEVLEEARNGKMGSGNEDEEENSSEGEREKKEMVVVRSSKQGVDSAELSHPILISRSQLEEMGDPLPLGSESDSDGDEFCDSVDEPIAARVTLDHTPHMDSLPSISEGEEELPLTSTPFNTENAVVTQAQVHNSIDAVIVPHYASSSSSAPPRLAPSHRGGGDVNSSSSGRKGQSGGTKSGQGLPAGRAASRVSSGSQDSRAAGTLPTGGAGGGGRTPTPGGQGGPPGPGPPIPGELAEQITVSLERLQRDMNSVLVRLSTLETIAISRHQLETQQAYMQEGAVPTPGTPGALHPGTRPRRPASSWWPFPTLPVKTVLVLLVWPFVVQWLLRFLARQRRARPPPR